MPARPPSKPQPRPQFAAQSVKLGELFADPILVEAPLYQRFFAWTAEEAERLLEDISAELEAGEEASKKIGDSTDYFLGTMLFIDRDATAQHLPGWPLQGAPRVFEVVDGLQRLTTLTILFCILRDLDADDHVAPDDGLLAAIGAGQGRNARARIALRAPHEAFFQAHVRAAGATHVMPGQDRLAGSEARIIEVREHFLASLTDLDAAQRRRLTDFLLERCYVVLIATTGIDRAHRMFMVLNDTGKPLARNDILKAEMLGGLPPAAIAAGTAAWDAMELRLGDVFESLFSHVRAMHGRPGSHIIGGIRAIAAESGGAGPFIDGVLQPAAAILDDIRNARHAGSPQSPAIARTLGYLGWLRAGDWIPSAMLWWRERGSDAAELAWFLAGLDRLAYGLRILGLGTTKRAQRFGGVIAAIRSGEDLRSPGSPLALTREETRNIHYSLRDLHARSAPVCKLLLLRLNDQMAGRPQALAIDDMTVEHVLPKKHGAGSQWRSWLPDPAQRDRCTESLGNLVLVTRAQNDRASNLDFARKLDVYFKTPGAPLPVINQSVRQQAEWKAEQIKEREADLMRHLDALWSLGAAGRKDAAEAGDAGARRRRNRTRAA